MNKTDKIETQDRAGELLAQNELLKVIAEQNREKIMEYDVRADTAVIYSVVNGRFVAEREIEHYVSDNHCGESLAADEDRRAYRKVFDLCLQKPTHTVVDLRCACESGETEWFRLFLASVADRERRVVCIAGRFVSIHKDKLLSEQMRLRAEMDALTGVYNHIAFEEVCDRAITGEHAASYFLMLDVDDFKKINDTQGHSVGDMVLQQTGQILSKIVEGHGVAGRLGGDEFAALVWDCSDSGQMCRLCEELRSELGAIVLDMEYSVSIGVSAVDGREVTFQDLYCEADQALYAAKNAGKNRMVFYAQMERESAETDPKVEDYELPAFDEMDDRVLLTEFGECMGFLTKEDYRDGLMKMLDSLLAFFDADCVALAAWEGDQFLGIDESHKESAQVVVRTLTQVVSRGNPVQFRELIDAKGNIFLDNVREIKDAYPRIYTKLSDNRIWSLVGHELCMDYKSQGVLFAVNPRKHMEERFVIRMLSEYLVARMMTQRVMEQREHETTHDRLTGLWNRNSFILSENLWREGRYGSLGIVTTDIVGLAYVNRDFGYLTGSKKLVAAAKTLKAVFEGYRIFRYDEDEMLVCCPNVARAQFEFLVGRLKEKLAELDFTVAMGYSWNTHANMAEQIAEAETVMNHDKSFLTRSGDLRQLAKQSMINEVECAMREGRYLVYMQPKVHVHTGRTVGAEALIRQMDPDLGMVSPAVFIPVLERYQLIHMVDLFVLEQVFRYQRAALDAGRAVVPISTNFSKLTIMHPELLARVKELADKYEIPEGLIHIEVTETVGDMDHVVIDRVADSLKELGFKLSMDDFGTHYSNLAVLIQYDFDSAKIDRSMIMDITTNEKSRMVVDYMTSLISDLGINCIAEGVETKEQVDIMKETKCEVIQGYYFGKPVPQDEFYEKFMEHHQ